MKKRLSFVLAFIFIFSLCIVPAYAQNTPVITKTDMETRNLFETTELMNTYELLFPDQYYYIEQYNNIGTSAIPSKDLKEIFNETKSLGEKNYTLIVYNNGQVFTNISQIVKTNPSSLLRGPDVYSKTETFQLGDLGRYITITVTYTIELFAYDIIENYSEGGSGFVISMFSRRYKQREDSSGPAYVMHYNVSMYPDGSGVLYDLGVGVGSNRAKGIAKLSTGWDSWLAYLFNAFI